MPKITIIICAIAVFVTMGSPLASIQTALASSTENEGFMPIFNGVDLTGWTGDTKGYRAENGILVAEPQGNLYTETEYGDFVLRFEFRLTPGANNGIGIRVPMNGKASREGLEIQILDDTAKKFAEAKPWQRHGSVYGIIPAKTGHLRPVGEWNQEEIRIQGSQVRVVLNGTEIVNADLQPYIEGEPTLDGKKHPGLKRERGHLSLAGHKTRMYFRNLYLKPLEPSTENQ